MLDSVWKRWALAGALAVVIAISITALLSRPAKGTKEKRADAVGTWKARIGVDLLALPKQHPRKPDSEAARGLDEILKPVRLRLGSRVTEEQPPSAPSAPPGPRGGGATGASGAAPSSQHPEHVQGAGQRTEDDRRADDEAFAALREALRAEMRFLSPELKPFPPNVVALLERFAPTLDAVAEYVESHDDIRWYENFEPPPRNSTLFIEDHLTVHRLLIGRAYLALERGEIETAKRMLSTSRTLNQLLIARQEMFSQYLATGLERLQLALLRRGGDALGVSVAEPLADLRSRYVTAMSAEAAIVLANSSRPPFSGGGDPAEGFVRIVAGGSLELAASEAVIAAANGVADILATKDPCVALSRQRPAPGGFWSGNFFMLNATEGWRRFVFLSLDRAITTAALTGRAASPCPSVTITVRDEGAMRTVEAKGLPETTNNVIALAERVTVPLSYADDGEGGGKPPQSKAAAPRSP